MKKCIVLLVTLLLAVSMGLMPALAEETHPEGKPWVNSDLFGRWPSECPAPEEQYELWANYDYYQDVLAKGEDTSTDLFIRAAQSADSRMMDLARNSGGTGMETEILHILYDFYSDTEKLEQDGLSPLMERVNQVKAVRTTDELTALTRQEGCLFGEAFFCCSMSQTAEGPAEYRISLQSVPFLGDFFPTQEQIEEARQILLLLGYSEEDAMRLSEELAGCNPFMPAEMNMTEREAELSEKMCFSLEEIREVCPPAAEMLKGLGLVKEGAETEELYRTYLPEMIAFRDFYTEENLELLKAAAALSMYRTAKEWLTPSLRRQAVTREENPYALDPFLSYVPRAVYEQAFVRNYVPEELEEAYYALAEAYKDAMRARIEAADWADPETKQRAAEKIDQMVVVKLLYPDGAFDCSDLYARLQNSKNLLEAEIQCSVFYRQTLMTFAGRPVIRGTRYFSSESALSTNGICYPWENAFYIGAAALVGETYDGTSRETVLGTIGYHIAHELSHGFDSYGGMYDAAGAQIPIFSETGMNAFRERILSIADQASRVEVLDGLNVQGVQMIGEILADLEGIRLSLDLAKKEENFDYDLFFRSFAGYYNWYMNDRDTYLSTYTGEVHPSPFFRVNFTVQHMDEFYETYPSVVEGTPMYLPPEERELIW